MACLPNSLEKGLVKTSLLHPPAQQHLPPAISSLFLGIGILPPKDVSWLPPKMVYSFLHFPWLYLSCNGRVVKLAMETVWLAKPQLFRGTIMHGAFEKSSDRSTVSILIYSQVIHLCSSSHPHLEGFQQLSTLPLAWAILCCLRGHALQCFLISTSPSLCVPKPISFAPMCDKNFWKALVTPPVSKSPANP